MTNKTYNPMFRIAELMNAYHSVDNMDYIIDKDEARRLISKEVIRKSKHISETLTTKLKGALKSKLVWNLMRDQFL